MGTAALGCPGEPRLASVVELIFLSRYESDDHSEGSHRVEMESFAEIRKTAELRSAGQPGRLSPHDRCLTLLHHSRGSYNFNT